MGGPLGGLVGKISTIPFGPKVVLIISLRAIAPTNIDYKVLDGWRTYHSSHFA